MRVLIFFDLPVKTVAERKAYATFRKNLLREGFIMVQESVYSRIATTRESAGFLEGRVASFVPEEGLVSVTDYYGKAICFNQISFRKSN